MTLRHASASGGRATLRASWVPGGLKMTCLVVGFVVLLWSCPFAVAQAPGGNDVPSAVEPPAEAPEPLEAPIQRPGRAAAVQELRMLGGRVFRRAAAEAEMALPALRAVRGRRARSEHVLIDRDMQHDARPGGTIAPRSIDAIQQARAAVPSAKFARVFPGDTLAKLAAQHKVDRQRLALLNRTVPQRIYSGPDIVCIAWTHNVQRGESLEVLAGIYNIEPRYLAELNGLDSDEPLQPGSQISVPGEFNYIYRKNGPSYLRVWRYVDESPRPPFDPQSIVLGREQVQRGEDLEAFLGKHQLAADFVCRMNGLSRDEPLEEGRWLLVEYSVEVNEGATPEEIALHFELPVERLLEVNQLEIGQDEFERGQRIQIPIGDRMRDVQPRRGRVLPVSKPKVFEVELQPDVSRSPR